MDADNIHLCAITVDGKLWHAIHSTADSTGGPVSWSPWQEMKPAGASTPGRFVTMDCVVAQGSAAE